MRILQVSSHYPPRHTGGAERVCRSLALTLSSLGHEVQVAAPMAESDDGGVHVRSLPAGAPRLAQKLLFDYTSPRATAALLGVMDEFQPDVVHMHNVYGIGSRLVAAASTRAATLVTLHDYWPIDVVAPRYRHGELVYPPLTRVLAPWIWLHRRWHAAQLRDACLVSPSDFLARRVGRELDRRMEVVRNGVDQPRDETARDRRMLFVGRLVPEKGLDEILPAMVETASRHGWGIDIAGDGPLRAPLAQRFPSVQFHGQVDPAPLYRSASILVVPSVWPENAPVVVLEGMAHGVAVLAAASGGVPEMLREGETGLLHAPGDAGGFARQLERLVSNESLRAEIGSRVRVDVAAYDWRAIATRYEGMYARACASWRERHDAVSPSIARPA